jgi:ParB/RepB/Spo0J family partition protein
MESTATAARESAAAQDVQLAVLLDIDSLVPSQSEFQVRRRRRFEKKALEDLAASIKSIGLLEPIVARPLKKGQYEIVAGERRYLAAKIAGRKKISATVRELTDAEAISVQVIENLQRVDPHPLDEAEGYEQLLKLQPKDKRKEYIDEIARTVGRSRSYVYLRLQLLKLSPAIQEALYSGKIDVSTAGYLCRIPTPELQAQCLKEITDEQQYGDLMTARDIEEHIRQNYTLELKAAPFPVDDETLVQGAPACGKCPKRSGNDPDLFGFIKGKEICTDTKCFAAKRQAAGERKAAELEAAGKTVIKGAAADGIVRLDYENRPRIGGGYIGLDDVCHDDPKHRKVREILGAKADDAIALVQVPKTKELLEAVPREKLTEILNEKKIKTEGQERAARAKETRKRNEKEAFEEEINRRGIKAFYEKYKGKPAIEDLRLIADHIVDLLFDRNIEDERLAVALGKNPEAFYLDAKLVDQAKKAEDLQRLMLLVAVAATDDTDALRRFLKRHKVDLVKIRRELEKEKQAAAAKKGEKK